MESSTVNTHTTTTEDARFIVLADTVVITGLKEQDKTRKHGFGYCHYHNDCLAASNIHTVPWSALSPLSNFGPEDFVAALPAIHAGSDTRCGNASVIMLLASEADSSYYGPDVYGLEELEESLGLYMLEDFGVPEGPVREDAKELREATVHELIESICIAPHSYRRWTGIDASTLVAGRKRNCQFDDEERAPKRQKLEDYRAPYLELMQPGIPLSVDV
ncbi:hypothetical protein CYLTODRAFT_456337 [Cylindrobasidium torrendii FP15055 ss-10]|uniref:Uncharacterized protein n=1 Tax=Cylindrobasidium torrendii FP15055 ss-10 TaxID=1314674 RepID=A0A0D7B7A8_9AGAR|nr:hypothetical protein CYLTODRAFT_456337 [Cylindrobasidium torrendii FP15055 ss-10]